MDNLKITKERAPGQHGFTLTLQVVRGPEGEWPPLDQYFQVDVITKACLALEFPTTAVAELDRIQQGLLGLVTQQFLGGYKRLLEHPELTRGGRFQMDLEFGQDQEGTPGGVTLH